jgi:hypothetical protein
LFPEGELTTESVLPTVKAMGAKNMMSLMMQTNLLQTKAAVEGLSLKRQKQDLKGLNEALKAQQIKDAGGFLEFDRRQDTKFSTGDRKRFGLSDVQTDARLATLFETYGPLLQSMYPAQFGSATSPDVSMATETDIPPAANVGMPEEFIGISNVTRL